MADDDEAVEDDLGDEAFEEDIVYSVNSFGADFLIDGLISRLESDDIFRPTFQRQFVWTLPQASKFIESILLGLPIPGIFLYREESTRKHLIIDGLQRLTTIAAFASGRLPGSDRIFRLEKIKSKFNGKEIRDLDKVDQRRFYDTALHATIIQQLTPENDQSSVYYIFERLNTGGTPLQPQEIRAALYHGPFQEFLQELNDDLVWRRVFGAPNKRGKDLELLLRFFAFRFNRDGYKAPMKTFLNNFFALNRTLRKYPADTMAETFLNAINIIVEAVGFRAFRPIRSLNVATFDSVMTIVSQNITLIQERGKDNFAERYNALMADLTFRQMITRSTADDESVKRRFDTVTRFLIA